MELLTLRTFLAVIDEGGILAASRKLNTVQSNITTRIQRLEEELGSELFHRQGRKLELAAAGRVLRDYAERMLALEEQTRRAVSAAGSNSGELRIGTMETFAAVHLPQALRQVREIHPGLALKVETQTTQALIERLLANKLDCAFVGGPVEHPALSADNLLVEKLVLIRSRYEGRTDLPLILFREGCAYRARALSWQRECGHPVGEVMELGTLDGILGCVAAGLGQTLMPQRVATGSVYTDQLEVQSLPPAIAQVPTVMIRRRDVRPLAAMETLRKSVVAGGSTRRTVA